MPDMIWSDKKWHVHYRDHVPQYLKQCFTQVSQQASASAVSITAAIRAESEEEGAELFLSLIDLNQLEQVGKGLPRPLYMSQ